MPSNPAGTRMCAACRERADRSELLRVVRTPSGEITVDRTKKADGRGVWVHPRPECLARLIKKKALNAAFKCAVPTAVYEEIEREC